MPPDDVRSGVYGIPKEHALGGLRLEPVLSAAVIGEHEEVEARREPFQAVEQMLDLNGIPVIGNVHVLFPLGPPVHEFRDREKPDAPALARDCPNRESIAGGIADSRIVDPVLTGETAELLPCCAGALPCRVQAVVVCHREDIDTRPNGGRTAPLGKGRGT